MNQLSPELKKALLRIHPSYFALMSRKIIFGENVDVNWHHSAIGACLEDVYEGRLQRLIINAPPRSFKTATTTIGYPAWLLGKKPSTEIIIVGYSLDIAHKWGDEIRTIMNHDFYKELFPHTVLSNRNVSKGEITTTAGGSIKCTSFESTLTGLGGDYILIDDPIKAGATASHSIREKANDDFAKVVSTRPNDPTKGAIILCMQRLHVEDLTGFLLSKPETNWKQLSLPAKFAEDASYQLVDGHVYHAKAGDLLHEKRLPQKHLKEQEIMMGQASFSAQYLQTPILEENNGLNRDHFGWYNPNEIDLTGARVVHCWDTAVTAKETSNYTAFLAIARKDNRFYITDIDRFKMNAADLPPIIVDRANLDKPQQLLIERAPHAEYVIEEVKKQINGDTRLIPYEPKNSSKQERLDKATPRIQNKRVFLPETHKLKDIFLEEVMSFPKGHYDDLVDCLTMGINYLAESSGVAIFRIS